LAPIFDIGNIGNLDDMYLWFYKNISEFILVKYLILIFHQIFDSENSENISGRLFVHIEIVIGSNFLIIESTP